MTQSQKKLRKLIFAIRRSLCLGSEEISTRMGAMHVAFNITPKKNRSYAFGIDDFKIVNNAFKEIYVQPPDNTFIFFTHSASSKVPSMTLAIFPKKLTWQLHFFEKFPIGEMPDDLETLLQIP